MNAIKLTLETATGRASFFVPALDVSGHPLPEDLVIGLVKAVAVDAFWMALGYPERDILVAGDPWAPRRGDPDRDDLHAVAHKTNTPHLSVSELAAALDEADRLKAEREAAAAPAVARDPASVCHCSHGVEYHSRGTGSCSFCGCLNFRPLIAPRRRPGGGGDDGELYAGGEPGEDAAYRAGEEPDSAFPF